jgi:hypothetical protein
MRQARLRLQAHIDTIDVILDNTLLPAIYGLLVMAVLLTAWRF